MRRVRIGPTPGPAGWLVASVALALVAISAAPAIAGTPAPKPPSAYTGYAQVTVSSATLKANVNPHGLPTVYYFQYGPTTAYGAQTPAFSAGSGTQGGVVSQTVDGLAPNTTYHYRALAVSSGGTAVGQDAVLTTKKIRLSLAIVVSPNPVVFGEPLSVSGTLSGTGNAGVGIVLQGNPYPYTRGYAEIGSPRLTDAAGDFRFALPGLAVRTKLRAVLLSEPTLHSAGIAEVVTPHVTLHIRPTGRPGFVRLYGTVTPVLPRSRVAFERLTHGHRYVPFSGTKLRPGRNVSRFSRAMRLGRGVYRVLVRTYGSLASVRSRPIVIR